MKSMLLTETMKRLENWSVFFSETKGEPKNIRSKIFLFRNQTETLQKNMVTLNVKQKFRLEF